MIDLNERTRRVSGSRLIDLLRERGIASVVDPFMGMPDHLNYLKRHGIRVHGGDMLEWFVRAGEGLVVNDFTVLRDNEVAEIVEMLPGRIYPVDLFKGWDGVFFSEEQCQYLGVWHANVHTLRSDGQTGLAIVGLWHVLCYWLQKSHAPDEMAPTRFGPPRQAKDVIDSVSAPVLQAAVKPAACTLRALSSAADPGVSAAAQAAIMKAALMSFSVIDE